MKFEEIESGIISGDRYLSPTALGVNAARAASALHSAGIWQDDSGTAAAERFRFF